MSEGSLSLGSLLAKIGLDTSELKKGVAESEGIFGTMQGAAKGAALGVAGIGVAAGAFAAEAAHTFADVGSEVIKLQRETGGSAEAMSRLRFAAEESGVDVDSLARSMGLFSKKLEAGKSGLDEMGVTTKNAQGQFRPLNDILLDTAQMFEKMPNGVEKNALAIQLFGKAGLSMLPMLNRGKDGLADLEKEADKFGITMGQDNVDAVMKSTMAHREFHAAMQGLQIQIGEYVLPLVTRFTEGLVSILIPAIKWTHDVMGDLMVGVRALIDGFRGGPWESGSSFQKGMNEVGLVIGKVWEMIKLLINEFRTGNTHIAQTGGTIEMVERAGLLLRQTFDKLLPIIKEMVAWVGDHLKIVLIGLGIAFVALLSPIALVVGSLIFVYARFQVVRDVIAAFIDTIQAAQAAVTSWVKDNTDTWAKWGAALSDVWDHVVAVIKEAVIIIQDVVGVALELIIGLWDRFGGHLWSHVVAAFNAIVEVFKGVFETLHGVFDLFADLFTGKWGKLWGDVKLIFQGVWDLIKGVLRLALDEISLIIGLAMAVISEAWHYLWMGIKDVLQEVWDAIKWVVQTYMQIVYDIVFGAIHALEDAWGGIWHGMESVVSGVWETIKNVVRGGVNFVIDGVNSMLRSISSIKVHVPKIHIPGTSEDIGGGDIGFPDLGQIPRFHNGGVVPGPSNQEVLAILRGGERVSTNSQPNAPSKVYHNQVTIQAVGSPADLASRSMEELDWMMAQAG